MQALRDQAGDSHVLFALDGEDDDDSGETRDRRTD